MSRSSTLTWYTKPDCGLCDRAWPHVERAARLLRLQVDHLNILEERTLEKRYGTRIPVLARGEAVLAEGAMTRSQIWRALVGVRIRSS